jgi:charged multivesicular body protein 3
LTLFRYPSDINHIGMIARLFGQPKKSPEEQAKEWKRELQAEKRKIDTDIRKIRMEEQKVVKAAKQAAKQDPVALRMLAKQILHSRKAVNRLITTQTQMNSVCMQLQNQMSQIKVMGSLAKSTEVMSQMNSLAKCSEIRQVALSMGREMTKAGLIDEMVSDVIDGALDEDVEEDELDDEVAKVVEEMMATKMAGARVGQSKLPQPQAQAQAEGEDEVEEEEDAEVDEMMNKYKALRGDA